jgi:hypothetical protein
MAPTVTYHPAIQLGVLNESTNCPSNSPPHPAGTGLPATAFSSSGNKLHRVFIGKHFRKQSLEDQLDRDIILICVLRRVVQRM